MLAPLTRLPGVPYFSAVSIAVVVDGDHDLVQTIVHFFAGPVQARAVLRHLEA